MQIFLKELEALCSSFDCELGGCGCCGSPFIENFYTIGVSDINFIGKILNYEVYVKQEYKKYLGSVINNE